MIIKNDREKEALVEGGRRLGEILFQLSEEVQPGIQTRDLDQLAEELILKAGGKPSFKGYTSHRDEPLYPASLCVSINDEVVHGIPKDTKLENGDIVGLDIGIIFQSFYTDMAVTLPVGNITSELEALLQYTQKGLFEGIQNARNGLRVGDIGYAIEQVAKNHHYGIVRELVGHGVGNAVHEDPQIPNYGRRGKGPKLISGMVIAIEPMFTLGSEKVYLADDGWTWLTRDHKPAAHFEHTVLITDHDPIVLTAIAS